MKAYRINHHIRDTRRGTLNIMSLSIARYYLPINKIVDAVYAYHAYMDAWVVNHTCLTVYLPLLLL